MNHRHVARKLVLEGGWVQKRLFDIGQMKANAKLVTTRKVQKSTGFTIVQVGMKSGAKSQRLAGTGRNALCKEVLLRILPMKANGTGATSA